MQEERVFFSRLYAAPNVFGELGKTCFGNFAFSNRAVPFEALVRVVFLSFSSGICSDVHLGLSFRGPRKMVMIL